MQIMEDHQIDLELAKAKEAAEKDSSTLTASQEKVQADSPDTLFNFNSYDEAFDEMPTVGETAREK